MIEKQNYDTSNGRNSNKIRLQTVAAEDNDKYVETVDDIEQSQYDKYDQSRPHDQSGDENN